MRSPEVPTSTSPRYSAGNVGESWFAAQTRSLLLVLSMDASINACLHLFGTPLDLHAASEALRRKFAVQPVGFTDKPHWPVMGGATASGERMG